MHEISNLPLSIDHALQLLKDKTPLHLGAEATGLITASHQFLQTLLADQETTIYGVNTGFGAFCNVRIEGHDLSDLQYNLLRSHSCGVGSPIATDLVRLMLLLKVHSLALGHSGVQLETVQRLIDLYNHDVLPVVYDKGSLGASGDLVPLAHLSLPLIGEGEVWWQGKRLPAADVYLALGWQPIVLGAKEGLALINGTQFTLALAVWAYGQGRQIAELAHMTAALSAEAYQAKHQPYHALIQLVRPHKGQILSAERMRYWLEDAPMAEVDKKAVQDPYSFRCIPQVHGASLAALDHIGAALETEINSVTDNPLLFVETEEVLMGGNFHGQPIALPADYLTLALSELGSISERRTYLLLGGKRGLPEFLTANPGLESGLMIPQYAAASLASLNKQLCTPASADSIVSSNGQEDHVSMGANAALKALMVADNVEQILAIEWLTAAQALYLRGGDQGAYAIAPRLADRLTNYRHWLGTPTADDRIMAAEISRTRSWLVDQSFNESSTDPRQDHHEIV